MMVLIKTLYLFLPSYGANMAPVFASALKLPFGQPISQRFFGGHKTWRGFIAGFMMALIFLYIQKLLFIQDSILISKISILKYDDISIFLYAFILGTGAITGDLIKSFFKRRLHKKPGSLWFPFDQIDFIIGAIVFLYPFYKIGINNVLILLTITPALHLLANTLGYIVGLKRVWW